MRTYPRNSPHAAARIVAVTLICDGQIKPIELTALERMGACFRLGVSPAQLHEVVHELCADLLDTAAAAGRNDCTISTTTLASLLANVDDPALRRTVFELCAGVARADRMMHEGELIVLIEAINRWRIDQDTNAAAQPSTLPAAWPLASRSTHDTAIPR